MLSCRLASGPLLLVIYLFLWWFLLAIFGLFLLHWRYELPCQDKLPEFHCTPILGCIRVLWLVFHPLGLGLDKALCGWNSVKVQPRQGHLERLKRIYAYVIRTKDYATRFRMTKPDYSYLPDQNFDWAHTVYGHVQEIIPDDIPHPLVNL